MEPLGSNNRSRETTLAVMLTVLAIIGFLFFLTLLTGGWAVYFVLVVLGLGSDEGGKRDRHAKDARQGREHGGGGPATGNGSSEPVKIALVTRADMEVCLVTGQGEALIDAQTLVSGTSAGPYGPADNYRLDLQNGGPIKVEIDGTPHPLDPGSPATYHIDSNGIEKAPEYRGPGCP